MSGGTIKKEQRFLMRRLSLFQRFSITGFVILVLGTLGIGWWLGAADQSRGDPRVTSTSALLHRQFHRAELQELGTSRSSSHVLSTAWSWAVCCLRPFSDARSSPSKSGIRKGASIYSTNPALMGGSFRWTRIYRRLAGQSRCQHQQFAGR